MFDPLKWFAEQINGWIWDATKAIFGIIATIVNGICSVAVSSIPQVAHKIPVNGDGMVQNFTTNGATDAATEAGIPMASLFGYAIKVFNTLKPLCYTILAVIILISMVRELQKPGNGPSNVPYAENIFWIWFKFAILKFLMDRSMDITVAIFNTIADVTVKLGALAPKSTDITQKVKDNLIACAVGGKGQDALQKFMDGWNFGMLFSLFAIYALVGLIVAVLLYVTVYLSSYGRWMQLFVILPLAPIFFALAGLDETKQMFWHYVKEIVASSLAFLMTVVVLLSLPDSMGNFATSFSSNAMGFLSFIGIEALYVFVLRGVGGWAHDLVGG